MEVEIRYDSFGTNWEMVTDVLKRAGMRYYDPDVHRRAFEASHTTVFAYCDGRLIGVGRAISDGCYQAAVYDIAVIPEFQGKGIGKTIIKSILSRLSQCNIILYASPGKEDFYKTFGFRKMKTAMAIFVRADIMTERGFTE